MGIFNKNKLDFNKVSVVLTILFFFISIIATFQIFSYQQTVDLLENQKSAMAKENDDLRLEIDPEWHKKFNDQKEYYESELINKEKELKTAKQKKDSLEKFSPIFKKLTNGDYAIKKEAVKKVVISLIKNQQDSLLIQLDSFLIYNLESQIKDLKAVIKNDSLIITNQEKLINIIENPGEKEKHYNWLVSITSLIFGLVGFVISFLMRRKQKGKEN